MDFSHLWAAFVPDPFENKGSTLENVLLLDDSRMQLQ